MSLFPCRINRKEKRGGLALPQITSKSLCEPYTFMRDYADTLMNQRVGSLPFPWQAAGANSELVQRKLIQPSAVFLSGVPGGRSLLVGVEENGVCAIILTTQ
jgi:hypothetical protein